MQHTLAPWTGTSFIMAGAQPAVAPSGRVRRWSLQVGRYGIAFSSITENYGPPAVLSQRRDRTGLALGAVAGGLALLVVGASAGRAWPSEPVRSDNAMPIPAAKPYVAPAKAARPGRERPVAAPTTAPAPVQATSTGPDATLPTGAITRLEAIERALHTGEFQEWTDRTGVTGFVVPGVAEVTAAGDCRTLAVLVRKPDGTDAVTSDRQCRPAAQQ